MCANRLMKCNAYVYVCNTIIGCQQMWPLRLEAKKKFLHCQERGQIEALEPPGCCSRQLIRLQDSALLTERLSWPSEPYIYRRGTGSAVSHGVWHTTSTWSRGKDDHTVQWRSQPCDPSIRRRRLRPPAMMARLHLRGGVVPRVR
jgi:hypothetical protein